MKFRNASDESDADINLTPLIDVVFLLLIFFMVTTTFSREAEIKLKLPEADSGEKVDPESRFVTVQINDIGEAILETYIHPTAPPVIDSPVQMMAVPQ